MPHILGSRKHHLSIAPSLHFSITAQSSQSFLISSPHFHPLLFLLRHFHFLYSSHFLPNTNNNNVRPKLKKRRRMAMKRIWGIITLECILFNDKFGFIRRKKKVHWHCPLSTCQKIDFGDFWISFILLTTQLLQKLQLIWKQKKIHPH